MTTPTPIPQPIIDYLQRQAGAEPADTVGEASTLLTEHGHNITSTSKTLADYGTIVYIRRFFEYGSCAVRDEPDHINGVELAAGIGKPWPDDGGREACDLLNDGWRLMPASAADNRWEFYNPDHLESRLEPEAIRFGELTNPDMLVLAREVQP